MLYSADPAHEERAALVFLPWKDEGLVNGVIRRTEKWDVLTHREVNISQTKSECFFLLPPPKFFHEYYTTLVLGEFGPLDLVLSL